ncbi:MAG: Sec-independent protein translocase protein TatB [Luteimonas sp.]
MFDFGFSELVVIAVVALIVLGPERLPKAARFAGLWVRRARAQWHSVRSELEREMATDELKQSLQDAKDAVRETEESVRDAGQQARGELNTIHDAVRDTARDADGALKPPNDSDTPAPGGEGSSDTPGNGHGHER